ncbi:MAG: hypothetical protein CMJ64_01950 [Planctomycetaceae bacterium]|nr:hypothetical protein [Planctomycetaceae bacterium]
MIPLDTAEGGECASCGRHYSGDVLRDAFAETVQIGADGEASTREVATPVDDDRIGKTFGHYEVVARLGEGGMGSVYRALDKSLQRYVALKVIRSGEQSASGTRQLQRLFQEAIAQARVNHPNVVHIYYVGRDDDSPFLAMELVDGETLADQLARGPLPFADIIDIAIQVVDALRHSVSYDILHGDIKPSNILLTRDGTAKLSDFGLARRLSQAADAGIVIAGTPVYMAPEAMQPDAADLRSDMYSLGVTLFEMTFGRLPYTFEGSTVAECLGTHKSSDVEFPEPWPPEVPSGWYPVLAKLLSKFPEERYQSYDDLLQELRALRPANLPKAGRVQRTLAWLVDLALVNTVLQILTNRFVEDELRAVLSDRLLVTPLVLLVGAAAPLLASAVQASWRTTPGKKLFQIRVVDRHGLVPSQSTLAARMVFQMLPLWAGALGLGLQLLGGDIVLGLAGLGIGLTIIVDSALAIVRRDGRSLHDLLFDTRVVLDVPSRTVADAD